MTDATLRQRREALVRHHIEVEMAGDADEVIATFAHPRYVLVALDEVLDGEEAVAKRVHGIADAMPGAVMEIASLRHSDDAVIVETVTRGRHTAELLGMPPTGNVYVTKGIAIFRFEGEYLIEEVVYYDRLSLIDQLHPVHDAT